MRARLICVLLLACAAAAQTKPEAKAASGPPEAGQFQIAGSVVDAATSAPVAEAEVALGVSGKPEVINGVLTGADGRFIFRDLPAGKYWLAAEHRRYPRQGYGQHEGYFVGVVVGPKVTADDLLFRMQPGSSVEGTVTDEQGDGVRHAKVMLFHNSLTAGVRRTAFHSELETDDQGHYLFSHLVPGRYYLAVHAEPWYTADQLSGVKRIAAARGVSDAESIVTSPPQGSQFDVLYPVTYYANATDTLAATPIDVKGAERTTADVVLMPMRAVHFKFRCAVCGSDLATTRVVQESFGGYEIPVGTPGGSPVTALGPDGQEFIVPPGPAVIRTGMSRGVAIDAADGLTVDGQTASVSAQVSGRVLMDDGTKLKEPAGIMFVDGASGQTVAANNEGEKLAPVPLKPGTYSVYVANRENATVKSLVAEGAKVVGQSIEIAEGAQAHLEITLTKGSVDLSGTALREGKPVAGAMVLLVPQDMEHNEALIRRDESDSDGTFLLRATPPGKYTLVAIENSWEVEWKKPEVLEPYLKAGQAVVVKAGGKYELKVTVQ
jgi:hypothetical protein